MADKYLSEQKLKKKLAYIFRVYNFTPSRRKDIYAAIEKARTADVAPVVHGQWLNFYNDFSCAECDRCGTIFEVTGNETDEGLWNAFKLSYKYCPNCGAKMDEEVNDNGRI